jgi:hypothetical protein
VLCIQGTSPSPSPKCRVNSMIHGTCMRGLADARYISEGLFQVFVRLQRIDGSRQWATWDCECLATSRVCLFDDVRGTMAKYISDKH